MAVELVERRATLHEGLENPRIWVSERGGGDPRTNTLQILRDDCISSILRQTFFSPTF